MSRLMSVSHTTDQVRARTKTETRRLGWWTDKNGRRLVKAGDTLTLCEKVMGRRKGEPLVRICDVLVTDVRREPLLAIRPENCVAEGFPQFSPTAFVGFFTNTFGVAEDIDVTVIVWCNPPYSDIRPWVAKAWASDALVVMLLPANRTEQAWWMDLVEPYRDRGLGLTVEFLRGRIRFLSPGARRVGPNERPPFGCCLLTWDSHDPKAPTELQGVLL